MLTFDRRSVRYRSVRADQTPLLMRIREIAQTRMRYGYFRIYIFLRREGWAVNHKRVYRIYWVDVQPVRDTAAAIAIAERRIKRLPTRDAASVTTIAPPT